MPRCERICALAALLLATGSTTAAEPSLIPWPAKVASASGSFEVDEKTLICAAGAARAAAEQLQTVVKAVQGLNLTVSDCESGGITLILSATAATRDAEGYTLDVSATGVSIEARAAAGLYYGAMTAAQLLSSNTSYGKSVRLAGTHIEDSPRFKWRGLMLDPARHFIPVADVKLMLDQMGQHKLNVMHFHLTDDQGWRIEIRRYPELTEIGAWRKPPASGGSGETGTYGGFYTQQDIREIVRYAAERHITIVPEIDLPGHAQAVVAAHPQLSVLGDRPEVSNNWGVNYHLYNTNEYSLGFIKNVLDEVMQLFPGKYIHLGGDEAIKDQWRESQAVQAQMKALGLANEEELQGWFMGQVGAHLAAHGRIMVGWDEVLDGAVPANTTVMSWRGIQGAITAARLGHDVVMSPAPTLYFDNLQSTLEDEPAGRVGPVTLEQVYNFEAMPAALTADEARHVLGGQAAAWSEYLVSNWHLQRAIFPRAAALSEAVWGSASRKSWAGFLARLPAQMQRYERQRIAAADTAFAVDFQSADGRNTALREGAGAVTLLNQTGFGEIRYTLDGSTPDGQSTLYTMPLTLQLGAVIKAAVFSEDGSRLAAERTYQFTADTLSTRTSTQLHACPGGHTLVLRLPLTPDSPAVTPAFNLDVLNGCYVHPKAWLADVKALSVEIARLPRNFSFANRKNQLKSRPARSPFGELVVHRGRCESGEQIARVALPDPRKSDSRQRFDLAIAPVSGEHDLCFFFTGPMTAPLYAIDKVRLLRR